MKVIEDSDVIEFEFDTYIALGSFDGLHLGHMSLIDKTVELARKNNARSMVYTFKNHPLNTINKELAPKLILSNDYKIQLLEKSGIDYLTFVEFNKAFMKILPEDFIENLIKKYNAKGIVVGFNYRFGFKNLGDVEVLSSLSKVFNFELYIIDPIKIRGDIVSSSRIRELICEGDIMKANHYLSRPFMLEGKVIKGKRLGNKIGFPTANIDYDKSNVLPQGGVYYTVVEVNGLKYKGITNVGYNPTTNDNKLSIETYILNFDKDIYNQTIRLFFIKRIRDEKKFNSLDELIVQLKKDKQYAARQPIN
jgi:riboflavin kinase / FMN adenylyltransferase